MEIDLNKSTEEILNEWANHIQSQNSQISKEVAYEIAKKTMPYLKCPMNNNERVLPMNCMFCTYGHMTDCHFPLSCEEAECSHYTQQLEYENYLEFESEED